jgi:RimJ/RimL family protein N-acetyltransferase
VENSELRTDRLRLRRWRQEDRAPFASLNSDPVVMEFFPAALSQSESDEYVGRIQDHFERYGFGLWAVEVSATAEFAGYVGLWPTNFDAHFTPAVEVGWRLARRFWGSGFAPEGARAAVRDGFDRLGLAEIVSFTAESNMNSRRVMEKLRMTHDPGEDFDHPTVPESSPLRRHVLYRLSSEAFRASSARS